MAGDAGAFQCPGCGRRHPWRAIIAGKQIRCACGQMMQVPPQVSLIAEMKAESTTAAPYSPAQETLTVKPAAKAKGSTARLSLDVQLAAARASRRADTEWQERQISAGQGLGVSIALDWVVPPALIVGGIVLLFVEALSTGKNRPETIVAAVPVVTVRLALKAGLTLAGLFLAVQFMEVTLAASRVADVLKLFAVAIGPAAAKGLIIYSINSTINGPIIAVLLSVAIYAALFRVLLKTDFRDTSICVIVTWVLLAFVDYMAYKYSSFSRDSWI